MTKDILRRLITIALLLLLAATGASCIAATSGTSVEVLPSPSAVPDPHPTVGVS